MSDYEAGKKDCAEGVPHTDRSDEYNRGYSEQYTIEQIVDSLTGA